VALQAGILVGSNRPFHIATSREVSRTAKGFRFSLTALDWLATCRKLRGDYLI
jgi:hypothetical protein